MCWLIVVFADSVSCLSECFFCSDILCAACAKRGAECLRGAMKKVLARRFKVEICESMFCAFVVFELFKCELSENVYR